jgi:putative peptidoglycan lipid II flippase
MSRQIAGNDQEGMHESLRFALVLILLIALPAAVGLLFCARPVYSLFFMSGKFTAFDVVQSAKALIWYAPGLVFVGISRVVAPTFFAMKDTRTPVLVSFWTLLVNAGLGLVLMQYMGHVGLALALTLASVFNALVLSGLLVRKLGDFGCRRLLFIILRLIPGLLIMGLSVWYLLSRVDWLQAGPFWPRFSLLLASIVVGSVIYGVSCWLCGVPEVRQSGQFLRNKFLKRGRGTADA